MRNKTLFGAVLVALLAPSLAPVDASAQSRRTYHGKTYRGKDGRYYRCKRSKGTTGTIAGGAGGALAANALGGGTIGTIAGGVGGALLGRHLDKKHDAAQNRRNGC